MAAKYVTKFPARDRPSYVTASNPLDKTVLCDIGIPPAGVVIEHMEHHML